MPDKYFDAALEMLYKAKILKNKHEHEERERKLLVIQAYRPV